MAVVDRPERGTTITVRVGGEELDHDGHGAPRPHPGAAVPMIRATGTPSQRPIAVEDVHPPAVRRGPRRRDAGSSRNCRSRAHRPPRPEPSTAGRRRPGSRRGGPSSPGARRVTPSRAMSAAVVRTSSPSPAATIRLSPVARAAMSRARWLIDLSPGRRGSPRKRAAGRTTAGPTPDPAVRVGSSPSLRLNAGSPRRP